MSLSARLATAAVTAAILLAGCSSASEPSPPTGVDELVIPTPSLDPGDFVDAIDNPWLPLAIGSEWEYRATISGELTRIAVSVPGDTRQIQGVAATAVHTTVLDVRDRLVEERVAWFAQDDAGNVWQLGEEGVWEAGVDGAQAGLAMPSQPRVGDGYRTAYAEGVAEDRARVLSLDASASVPYGDLAGLLEVEHVTPLQPGVVSRRLYAPDVGLVREEPVAGGEAPVVLVAFDDR